MITECNTQALLRCIRNNEEAPGFYLNTWFHHCGTYGCLVGNDLIATGKDCKEMPFNWAMSEYGLGYRAIAFLFYALNHVRSWSPLDSCNVFRLASRDAHDRAAAINRIRKFVYYVLHKRELMYDDSGRVRETARRAEGNHMVLAAVKRRMDEECAGAHDEPAYLASIGADVPALDFPQTRDA